MNLIIMGNFLYPTGMACTKRIQHYIDYLRINDVFIRLLILRQAEAKLPKAQCEGHYKGIFYKTIGNDIQLKNSLIFAIFSYFWHGSVCLVKWKEKSKKNIILYYGEPNIENFWFIF